MSDSGPEMASRVTWDAIVDPGAFWGHLRVDLEGYPMGGSQPGS